MNDPIEIEKTDDHLSHSIAIDDSPNQVRSLKNKAGLILLIGLASLFVGSGLGNLITTNAFSRPSFWLLFWIFFSVQAMVGYFFASTICLALLERSPGLRLLLFQIIVPLVFFALTSVAMNVTSNSIPQRQTPFQFYQSVGVACLALIPSMAWPLWLIRIQRGWRIKREEVGDDDISFEPSKTERNWLLISVAITLVLCGVFCIFADGRVLGVLFAQSLLTSLIFVLPLTYFMMRTRWPLTMAIVLVAGFSLLPLAVGIGMSFRDYVEAGFIPDEAIGISLSLLSVFLFPTIFLVAMRWAGFRLAVVKNWRLKKRKLRLETKRAIAPIKHPLDD